MREEGVAPGATVCSGLLHACLLAGRPELGRKVYDMFAAQVRKPASYVL